MPYLASGKKEHSVPVHLYSRNPKNLLVGHGIQLVSEQVSFYPLSENEVVIWIYPGQQKAGLSRALADPSLSSWAAVWLPEPLLREQKRQGTLLGCGSDGSFPGLPASLPGGQGGAALWTAGVLSATFFCMLALGGTNDECELLSRTALRSS